MDIFKGKDPFLSKGYNSLMNALIFLADGFEMSEALVTFDILTRSHLIHPKLISISSSLEVTTSMGVAVKADNRLEDIRLDEFDMIILPGGKKGVENLASSKQVKDAIISFKEKGKDVHAICAAPSILGKLGYLDGKNYTCFPGFESGKGNYINTGVVTDGHLVTGHSMGYSMSFAEAIVALYYGEEEVNHIRKGTLGR